MSAVRSIIGFAQYSAKFMPDVASIAIARAIEDVTRNGAPIK